MYEKEKQRENHLIVLLVYTFFSLILTGESLLLGWEVGAIVLLLTALIGSWVIYITDMVSGGMRLWLYFALTMISCFFYGIHKTSVFDLAPLMILIMILFSITEKTSIIRLCVITYYLTMCYDFIFVLNHAIELTTLTVTRTLLHLGLVLVSGCLVNLVLKRRKSERVYSDKKIEKLEETNRRVEDFLANVSHELRTPINAVTGISTVMLQKEEEQEKREQLSSVQMAGKRLFGQIEDILDYTEIDTNKIRLSEENYTPSLVVSDLVSEYWEKEEKQPELLFDYDTKIPLVLFSDERKIRKILKHLVDNAMKFTQEGGVYVRIFSLKKSYGINLCIEVSDTGVGIAKDELERITERFYQTSTGRNRKVGGLGLGLSIVYGMVRVMNGFMRIESEEGRGTTVTVSIPQQVAEENPEKPLINNKNLCVACFLMTEKYKVPQVREYYNKMIAHMVKQFDILLHRVTNRDELEQLLEVTPVTHLFVGEEEYRVNKNYLEMIDSKVRIVVVAGKNIILPQEKRIEIIRKPLCTQSVLNILKEKESDLSKRKKRKMICPGIKVLVVDDEPMNLTVAKGIFENYQMIVKTVISGKEAIAACEKERFDIIFLDHMMPEMDGIETLKQLRKMQKESGQEYIIVAFTANAVSGAKKMFMEEGFDEFVSKPIETMTLERVLCKVLSKSSITYVSEEKEAVKADERKTNFDRNAGLQYCRGDEMFYRELLAQFHSESVKKRQMIEADYEQKNMEDYRIRVHALKSTAKMIGAENLSDLAKDLEMAAKEKDWDFIEKNHKEVLDQYAAAVVEIGSLLGTVLEEEEFSVTQINSEKLLEELMLLMEKLRAYEIDEAEKIIQKLQHIKCANLLGKELIEDIKQDVTDFEFDRALNKTEKLYKRVERGECE